MAIAANLVCMRTFYDLAVRDVEIAIAAYTLARMSEVRQDAAGRTVTTRPARGVAGLGDPERHGLLAQLHLYL